MKPLYNTLIGMSIGVTLGMIIVLIAEGITFAEAIKNMVEVMFGAITFVIIHKVSGNYKIKEDETVEDKAKTIK